VQKAQGLLFFALSYAFFPINYVPLFPFFQLIMSLEKHGEK